MTAGRLERFEQLDMRDRLRGDRRKLADDLTQAFACEQVAVRGEGVVVVEVRLDSLRRFGGELVRPCVQGDAVSGAFLAFVIPALVALTVIAWYSVRR